MLVKYAKTINAKVEKNLADGDIISQREPLSDCYLLFLSIYIVESKVIERGVECKLPLPACVRMVYENTK